MTRKILLGCGGLLALGIVVFIALFVGVMIGGGGSSQSPPASDSKQDKPAKKTEPKKKAAPDNVEAVVGETAELRDRTLVVNEIERDYAPPNRASNPKAGNELVRLFITLTNTGSQAFDYNPNNFKVQDSSGVQRTPQSITELPYAFQHASLAPGGTLEGNMVVQVPQGDSELSLVYEPFEHRNLGTITVRL